MRANLKKKWALFKAFFKEYWWAILIRLGAPVLLNFIIFIPAFSPIVGGSSDWLSFYGSYIGLVIASLITLYVLYKNCNTITKITKKLVAIIKPLMKK